MSDNTITFESSDGAETLRVYSATYPNGRLAIALQSEDGMPYGTLSINVPDANLMPDEFIVPVRNLTPELLDAAKASKLFHDTGSTVSYGFVKNDPVWRLVADLPRSW